MTLLLEHHGEKFSKVHLSRVWFWGDLEPRRRYIAEGRSLLERAVSIIPTIHVHRGFEGLANVEGKSCQTGGRTRDLPGTCRALCR